MPVSQLAEFKSQCKGIEEELTKRMVNSKNKSANQKLLKDFIAFLKAEFLDKNEVDHDPWKLAMVTDRLNIPPELRNTRLCDLKKGALILADLDITCETRPFQVTIFMVEYNRQEYQRLVRELHNKENVCDDESTMDVSMISNNLSPKQVLNDTLVNVQRKPPRPAKEEELQMRKVKLILASESGTPLIVNKLQLESTVKNIFNNKKE